MLDADGIATATGTARGGAIATRRPRPSPCRLSVTAASVRPSGLNASALTSPPVSSRGAPPGSSVARVPEPDSLLLEADRDQPAVGAEPPRVAGPANCRSPRSCVNVNGRPSRRSPAEVPGDRRPVAAHRVERLPVGAEDRLPDGVRVAAQRLAGRRRAGVPEGHRPVEVRRHDRLAVRAEQQPVRARGERAGRRLARLPCARRQLDAAVEADRRGATVRAEGERVIARLRSRASASSRGSRDPTRRARRPPTP